MEPEDARRIAENKLALFAAVEDQRDRDKLDSFALKLKELSKLDDPIEPYLSYIDYLEEHDRQHEILIRTIEKCARDFEDDELYKNDLRYLKVWVKYADWFSEVSYHIFLDLFKKNIGVKLGFLYQSFCDALERDSEYQKCYEVYKYGIEQADIRNIDSLKQNFDWFNDRLVSYERYGTFIDKNCPSFLSELLPKRKRSLESNISLRGGQKRLKGNVDGNIYSYQIVKTEGKPDENWRLNLKMIYSDTGEEFTLEEIMCKNRGIYDLKCEESMQMQPVLNQTTNTTAIPLNDINEAGNDTDLLPEADPSPLKITSHSPTMTIFTKEANEEIMSLFNKSIPDIKQNTPPEHQIILEQQETNGKFQVRVDDEIDIAMNDPQTPPPHRSTNVVSGEPNSIRRTNLVPYMTPIPELTENSTTKMSALTSSPFIEEPVHVSPVLKSLLPAGGTINPLDDKIRSDILNTLSSPLSSYGEYNAYNAEMNKLPVLKKFFSTKNKKATVGNKNSMVEFDNELYCVQKRLGEGGYATVYLAESSTGVLDAIKIEKPANPWEFYILKQIEHRLPNMKSIISTKGLNLYKDEGYLILEYLQEGTLLDLVNHYKTNAESIDERLIMLILVELISTINSLHRAKIIHGDLKPDNCMLNLSLDDLLKIIDFGRSIDLSVLPTGVEFKSTWETDNQDCPEMRKNETWVYEVDYYGLANILHTLLFQDSIQTIDTDEGYMLKNSIKRYWNENWGLLFDILLNSKKNANTAEKLDEMKAKLLKQLEGSKTHLQKLKEELKASLSS